MSRPQTRRQRLTCRRLRHAERREHVLLDVVVPRHARRALHDVAGERRGIVGVRRERARRSHASRNVRREPAAERRDVRRIVADEIPRVFLETRRVRHDVPQRDRLRERRGDLEVEIAIDVGVEIELSLLHELHHGRPGEQLARGPDAKERALGIDRPASGDVGVAVALREQKRAVFHDRDGRARDVFVAEVRHHDPVDERLELGAVAHAARRGRRCGSEPPAFRCAASA